MTNTNLSQDKISGDFLCPKSAPVCQRREPRQPKEKSAGVRDTGALLCYTCKYNKDDYCHMIRSYPRLAKWEEKGEGCAIYKPKGVDHGRQGKGSN